LGKKLKEANPDSIIISSPHSDWGFEVPLFFLAKDFKGEINPSTKLRVNAEPSRSIKTYLIGLEEPKFYFEQGKKVYQSISQKSISQKVAIIGSGDMSHCLKEDGPYDFNPDGPKFDKTLIESLKKKDIETIFKLDEMYPEAGECGLRSFCFLLGILEASGINWQPEILSYEGPFGVGYLVINFKIGR